MEAEIDEQQYSRQLATFGAESMGKLIKMKVFIHGLKGLGIEIAKNLILAGPNKVVVQDNALTQIEDLGSNFYLTEQDVGQNTRAQASITQLQELNSYVQVQNYTDEISTDFLGQFDVVVFTTFYDREKLTKFGDFCHSQSIGFIVADTLGLYGYTFVDFGESFKCFDKTGEENKSSIVTMISKGEQGIVTVHEDKRHGFEDDQTVTFREVQGMSEVNGKLFKIKVINPLSFSIGDTSQFGEYTREGIVEQVKVAEEFQFKSYSKSLDSPFAPGRNELDNCDFEKFNRPELLHLVYNSLLDFHTQHQRLPHLNNEGDAAQLVELVKARNSNSMEIEGGIRLDEIDEQVVKNVSYFAGAHLSPISAFFGGIVAQEVIKFTGKYTPLRQWLHYEVFEALPEGKVNREPLKSRYDHQIAVFGQELQQKLENVRVFLIGAGALGCEYLKQLALMGASCGKNGQIFCTDDDSIEMSNLNRQFLFRKDDVGKSKSEQACKAVSRMNSALKHQAVKLRVSSDNEEFFNDDFFESLNFVVNAVDNVQARLFVDSRCVFYQLPLLESGTLGTKCNSQVILPRITQSYGDSQDPPEESIPLCTLKNFPHQIEHTIQWARDYFQGIFSEGPNEAAAFIHNPTFVLNKMSQEYRDKAPLLRAKLENLQKLASRFVSPTYESCVELARLMFEDVHHNMIAQLLYNFPLDHKTSEGLPFWSGPKRPPQVLNFDPQDPSTLTFIQSAANIFAYIFGLKYETDLNLIRNISSQVPVPKFAPKSAIIQENDQQNVNEKTDDDEVVIKQLTEVLSQFQPIQDRKINQVEFEKDDDSNYHIDFISACANLRARNYRIPEVDRFKVKLIAGKIIPAIATTTAMVVGAVGIEIYKLIQQKDVSVMKNSFMNLALPLWLFSEPLPAIKQKDKDYDPILLGPVKAIPTGFTTWDKITIKGPLTVQQFIDQIRDQYGVNVTIMSSGKLCLYNQYAGKTNAERLPLDLLQVYRSISGHDFPKHKKYLEIEVSGDTVDGVDAIMPTIKYLAK